MDISNSTSEHPEYEKVPYIYVNGIWHSGKSVQLIWAWKGQRSPHLNHLHIMDEVPGALAIIGGTNTFLSQVEMNRVYHDDEGPR